MPIAKKKGGSLARAASRRAVDRSLATARQQIVSVPPIYGPSLWNCLEKSMASDSPECNTDNVFCNINESRERKPLPETDLKVGKAPLVVNRWSNRKRKASKLRKDDADADEIIDKTAYFCHICETNFVFEAQYKSHTINCTLQSPTETTVSNISKTIVYQCTSCLQIFLSLVDYLDHFSKKADAGVAGCVDSSSKTRLAAWDACVCFLCGFATRRSMLTDHLRAEHRDLIRRSNAEDYYKDCQLCSQRFALTKSGKFLSPVDFLNHLSLRHPAAVILLKSNEKVESSEPKAKVESLSDVAPTTALKEATKEAFTTCRICDVDVLKSEYDDHLLSEHYEEFDEDYDPNKGRRLLFDPALRKRKRVYSPPPPLHKVYENDDPGLIAKHSRRRTYRWFKESGNHCRSCGWTAGNRTEYYIHVLCNLCRPESEEFNVRMKCPLCYVIANRSEILTHLCKTHDHQLGLSFTKPSVDTEWFYSYENEGLLAKEIIGYEWRCNSCCGGFYRRNLLSTHECRSNERNETFATCALCRVSLKNDILLKLHHRFEHEDARSGLQEACEDPVFVYSAIEAKSLAVRDYTQWTTCRLQNKTFSNDLFKSVFDSPPIFCTCGARFNSMDVFRLHTDVFHSKNVDLPASMLEIMDNLYRLPSSEFMKRSIKSSVKSDAVTFGDYFKPNIKENARDARAFEKVVSLNEPLAKLPESSFQSRNFIGLTVTPSAVPPVSRTLFSVPESTSVSSNLIVSNSFSVPQKGNGHQLATTSSAGFSNNPFNNNYPKRKAVKTPVLVRAFSLAKPKECETAANNNSATQRQSTIATDSCGVKSATPQKSCPVVKRLVAGTSLSSNVNQTKYITILGKPITTFSRSVVSADKSASSLNVTAASALSPSSSSSQRLQLVASSAPSSASTTVTVDVSTTLPSPTYVPVDLITPTHSYATKKICASKLAEETPTTVVGSTQTTAASTPQECLSNRNLELPARKEQPPLTIASTKSLSKDASTKLSVTVAPTILTVESLPTATTSQNRDLVGRILQKQHQQYVVNPSYVYRPLSAGARRVFVPTSRLVGVPLSPTGLASGKYFIRTPQSTITVVRAPPRLGMPSTVANAVVLNSGEQTTGKPSTKQAECVVLE